MAIGNSYNSDIAIEQGASVLQFGDLAEARFQSGASLIADANASVHLFGTEQVESTGLLTKTTGGSVTFNVTTADQGNFTLSDATRSPTIGVGRNAPVHTASPGSLFIRSDGSVSFLYWNKSDGTTGSVWQAAASA